MRTYDRLGWYMNKRLLWGGQEELERKLEWLRTEIRAAFLAQFGPIKVPSQRAQFR